jgi:hypothetical protein
MDAGHKVDKMVKARRGEFAFLLVGSCHTNSVKAWDCQNQTLVSSWAL